jgi:hypothetical protein
MNDSILKTIPLRARIRTVDRALLETLCARHGWNLSEGIRQAIRELSDKEGLYNIANFVVDREAKNGNPQ